MIKGKIRHESLYAFVTFTNVPLLAIELGGLRNSLIAGTRMCCTDHSRCAQAVSASASNSCSISLSPPSIVSEEKKEELLKENSCIYSKFIQDDN